MSLETLYNHLKTLTSQWFYLKTEVTTLLGGKVDKENGKGLSSNDYTNDEKTKLAGIETGATKITVDSSLSSTSTNPLENKAINTALSNKADSSSIPTKTSDLTNDGDGTNVFVKDNDSRLTDSRTPTSHSHAATEVTDANATNYSNIGSLSANATQQTINNALNTIIGTLSSIQAIQVVDSKPTASASTMGKLYIVSENSKVNVYYTKQSGSGSSATYSWQKMDADILDELNISWNDVTNKPDSFTPSSHTHGNITNAGAIGSTSGKVVVTGTSGVLTTSDMITEMDNVIVDLIDYGDS